MNIGTHVNLDTGMGSFAGLDFSSFCSRTDTGVPTNGNSRMGMLFWQVLTVR